jgi:hypothetical protein
MDNNEVKRIPDTCEGCGVPIDAEGRDAAGEYHYGPGDCANQRCWCGKTRLDCECPEGFASAE